MECSRTKASFSIQWHITTNCSNRCRHCYMFDESTYESERNNELDYNNLIKILDDIKNFEDKWGFDISNFFITGGDPLLRKDWKSFLEELVKRGKNIYLMGNPETLTEENLQFLSNAGIRQFQMSLDGMEENHDYFRSSGSFRRTVSALTKLKQHGIKGTIMSTLTPLNKDEFFELMEFVVKNTDAQGFAFDIVASVGNASGIEKRFTAQEIKDVFEEYLKRKESLYKEGYKVRIAEKSSLFKLLHYDRDEFSPFSTDKESIISGCHIGFTCFTIISDGTVMACRRFPLKVGKLPEQSIEEIFLGNEELKKFRRPQYYKACGSCSFFKVCRTCPAVVYGETGNPFDKNPVCFKQLIKKSDYTTEKHKDVSMNTDYEQEAELIKSHYSNIYINNYDKFLSDNDILRLTGKLLNDTQQRRKFLNDPQKYIEEHGLKISSEGIMFICYYLDGIRQNKIGNPINYYFSR